MSIGNAKKEVTCRMLSLLIDAIKEFNIEPEIIFQGIPYEQSYFLNKNERVEWEILCKLFNNVKPYFTPAGFEDIGYKAMNKGKYPQAIVASMMWFSTSKLAQLLAEPVFKIVDNDIPCLRHELKYDNKYSRKLRGWLDEGYEFSPEFFLTVKGVFKYYGSLSGLKGFSYDMRWIENGAEYSFTWENTAGFISKIKRNGKILINLKKTLLESTESHEALLNQYYELDESKRLLQKQTTNLKTAYGITKSILQTGDIKKTLYAITDNLVRNTELLAAYIKIYKDDEGKNYNIEVFSGIQSENIGPISKQITLKEYEIGELIIYPKAGADVSTLENLLNYLLPIINISIHNSLILRTITDYKNNLELKVEERTAELITAQEELSKTISLLKEAQQNQNRFFTNISHEFRTPLTLILGPAEQIMELAKNEKNKENARIIFRSAKKLKRLTNQLLDLARLGTNNIKLETRLLNLIPVLSEIVSSFFSIAEAKNIVLKFIPHSETIMIYLDRDKLEKIMNNLISNALKFTATGGKVIVEAFQKENEAEISVADTGIGIPENELNKVFDRFYQVDNKLYREFEGTGVGLSLTKELVELHKGRIFVESIEGQGSTFKVTLPLGNEHLTQDEIFEEPIMTDKKEPEDKPIPIYTGDDLKFKNVNTDNFEIESDNEHEIFDLMIVEDNADLRRYLSNIMKGKFRIIEAVNGEDGLNKSFEQIPDIIISDVMMPKMDGFQMVSKLKSDSRTSHIPVILLTAKATLSDKIEGFECGADSYIMKPFEAAELEARVRNLLEQRKRLHEYFRECGLIDIDDKNISSIDKKFLQKAAEVITQNISDTSFSIEVFAGDMAVSRSLLHKKFIALAGEPPGEFIKRIRLNKAAKLLANKFGNVTQIAYESGFNDPAYFAVCFKKQFGVSPSQYQKNNS